MSTAQIEIQLIAIVVSVACALPGVFLVLRRMAMMSDAISHSILFGIVIAFFITRDLIFKFLSFLNQVKVDTIKNIILKISITIYVLMNIPNIF